MADICAFCGAAEPNMDMTGKGWRCRNCSIRAEISAAEHGSDMGDHFSPKELDAIISRSRGEFWLGLVILIVSIPVGIGMLVSLYLVAGVMFAGFAVGGAGMMGHGTYTKNKAKLALKRLGR
jgi:hypothetical protein